MIKTCVCQQCGKVFQTDRKRKFCSVSCRYEAEHERKLKHVWDRKARHSVCLWCGKMTSRHDSKGYCSKECFFAHKKEQAEYQKKVEAWEESLKDPYRKIIACLKAIRKQKRTEENRKGPSIRITKCPVCGKEIKSHMGRTRIYCSRQCERHSDMYRVSRRRYNKDLRNNRERARHYGVSYEPVRAKEIFDRDHWTCQECGRATPKELRGTFELNAPELDHIVPMSKGGGHLRTNLQCLCRECNGAKSNKLFPKNFFRSRGGQMMFPGL